MGYEVPTKSKAIKLKTYLCYHDWLKLEGHARSGVKMEIDLKCAIFWMCNGKYAH